MGSQIGFWNHEVVSGILNGNEIASVVMSGKPYSNTGIGLAFGNHPRHIEMRGGHSLVPVEVMRLHAGCQQLLIKENASTRSRLSIDDPRLATSKIRNRANRERIAFAHDQTFLPAGKRDDIDVVAFQVLLHIWQIRFT